MQIEPVSSTGTQTPFVSRIFSPGRGLEGPDVAQIFAAGKNWKKIFVRSKDREEKKTEIAPPAVKTEIGPIPPNDHQFSFGVVYANALAQAEIEKETPQFPVGSIVVREKLGSAASEIPLTVIAMVKREKGFSEKTGEWEFFVFDGADLKLTSRETEGSCAACHVRAEKTDWVFRDYLNK